MAAGIRFLFSGRTALPAMRAHGVPEISGFLRGEWSLEHAARRTEGVSAIEKFYPVLQALHELERERNADVDVVMRRWPLAYPLSVGTVRSGEIGRAHV